MFRHQRLTGIVLGPLMFIISLNPHTLEEKLFHRKVGKFTQGYMVLFLPFLMIYNSNISLMILYSIMVVV